MDTDYAVMWALGKKGDGPVQAYNVRDGSVVQANYVDGHRFGEYKKWDRDGKLVEHLLYVRDRVKKDFLKLSAAEKLRGVFFSEYEGDGEFKAWHPNGKLRAHAWFKNCQYHGFVREYNALGMLVRDEEYQLGILTKRRSPPAAAIGAALPWVIALIIALLR